MSGLSFKIHAIGTQKKAKGWTKEKPVMEDCKGNLSVYGLNAQFPITLYGNQWLELLKPAVVAALVKAITEGMKAGTLSGPRDKVASDASNRVAL